jgi:hypothetical protein
VRGSAFNSFNDIARIVGVAALLSVSPARSFAQEAPKVAERCVGCPEQPAGSGAPAVPAVLELGQRTWSADDIRRLSSSEPLGRGFVVGNNAGVDLAELGGTEAVLEVYDYVVARTGVTLSRTISLTIALRDESSCPARGMAMWSPTAPAVQLFLAPSSDPTEALGILAHEVGHIAHALGVETGMSGDSNFDQGFATWAAGRYWSAMLGFDTFADAVASYRAAGTYLALDAIPEGIFPTGEPVRQESLGRLLRPGPSPGPSPSPGPGSSADEVPASADCLAKRDVWFTEWAAFIDYLIDRFGRERLLALMRTNQPDATTVTRPGVLDYSTVYGAPLEVLEADWLESIDARD